MNKEQQAQELQRLIQSVTNYSDQHEAETVLTAAFEIAAKAHEGVQRIDGQPYLHHPLAVAAILAEWHAPVQVVTVGLLHDLLNPQYSRGYSSKEALLERVHAELGTDVAHLLDVVVALNSFMRHVEGSDFYHQADTNDFWQGIATYLHQSSDAVLVKIADRLHNLQTCSVLTRSYQVQIASAGLHLLAPLVGRLGMGKVKCQAEDYCFQINDPISYQLLQQRSVDPGFQQEIAEVVEELQQVLNELLPGSKTIWRPASLYTIWQDLKPGKLSHLDPTSLRMVDVGSFIVLTQEEMDCYHALGLLHKRYLPVDGQVRDQIANRQENGYQSLHTQVKHISGNLLRIAIRTTKMDMVAGYGIAANWWGITEEFMPHLLVHKKPADGEIQVFTPKGEMRSLPPGATPLDFAYSIHTDVGHHCVDVLVNGARGDLYQPLQLDDQVEIIRGGPECGPKLEWLWHVKTPQAISRIRHWLSIHRRDEMVERGRALLDRELQALGLDTSDPLVFQLLSKLAQRERLRDVDDLLVALGVERNQPPKLVASLKSMHLKSVRTPYHGEPHVSVQALSPEFERLPRTFARCCAPVRGDDIVGYRRHDDVIAIHRRDCPQISEKLQLIQVKWKTVKTEPDCVIIIEALNRPGLARDICEIVTMSPLDMPIFHAARRSDGVMADVHVYLGRTTPAQRDRILKALEGVPSVNTVELIQAPLLAAPTLPSASSKLSIATHQFTPATTSITGALRYPNPYGSGIAEGSRFYGREVERERVLGFLRNKTQNVAILLWGQRRIGKTSFVLRLKEQAAGIYLPIYIDLQGLKDASTAMFLHRLMDRISQVFKDNAVDTPQEITVPAHNRLRKDPLAYFDTFMNRIEEITKSFPLVLILDEFQCLNSLREEGATRSAIFNRLRSHSQHGQGIHLILSGGGLLSYLKDQSDIASLFNIAHPEKLGCLESRAARQLIKDGLSKVGSITDNAITLLLSYTAGHPYYLQLLCSILYDYAQEDRSVLTSDVVSQRIREWLTIADASRFQHFWEGHDTTSTQRNKLILSALAQLGNATHVVEYDRLVNAIGSAVSEHDLVQSLNDLSELGVLNHHYQANYSVKVGLFARWLHQHYSLNTALKEASWL
jgi:GTP diphosphokinase / guanosine-3',5'-bis(diphosphate) 3'-diphosphatase